MNDSLWGLLANVFGKRQHDSVWNCLIVQRITLLDKGNPFCGSKKP